MNVFAYGSLVFPKVWEAITGASHPSEPGTISGFERLTVKGANYPGVIACSDGEAEVSGMIYRGVDPPALDALDAFEAEPYVRETVEARCENGVSFTCTTYVIPVERAELLSDEEWDMDRFAAEHLEDFLKHNFS